jgi:hypothetical protein
MNRMPNGARYAVSTGLAAAVAITAISNASPAVANTATPPTEGDIVVLDSGWDRLAQAVVRAGTVVAATSFQLERVDATDADNYPAGEGVGVFQKVNGFTVIDQVIGLDQSGGEQNWETFQYAQDKDGKQRQDKTYKSPRVLTLTLHYDPDKPWNATLISQDEGEDLSVIRETLKNGDVVYYVGKLSYSQVPKRALNVSDAVTVALALTQPPIRYPAA